MQKILTIVLLLTTGYTFAENYPYRQWPPYPSPYGYQYPYYQQQRTNPAPAPAKPAAKKPPVKKKPVAKKTPVKKEIEQKNNRKTPALANSKVEVKKTLNKPEAGSGVPENKQKQTETQKNPAKKNVSSITKTSTVNQAITNKPVSENAITSAKKPTQKQSGTGNGNNQFEENPALKAMKSGDYAIAYYIWRPMAEKGDARAQYSIGWMYHNGYGLSVNNNKAQYWWKKSAKQGFIHASFALGLLLSHGDAQVNENIPLAVTHLLNAALKGHQDARKMLIHLLFDKQKIMLPIIANWNEQQKALLGKKIRIKVKRANIRNGPGTENGIIIVLNKGDELIKIKRNRNWVQAYLPQQGRIVWVYSTLVEEVIKPAS